MLYTQFLDTYDNIDPYLHKNFHHFFYKRSIVQYHYILYIQVLLNTILNYGFEYVNKQLILYFHSAQVGRKIDAIIKNPNVCVEMDCDHRLIEGEKACDFSFGFKSIIGNGVATILSNYEEKLKGLSLLMKHETQKEYAFDENMVNHVSVIKVIVNEFSGKYHK